MSRRSLRQVPRISYCEPEEPDLDEYIFCDKCGDFVYEYCAIHGALLVIPDDKVPALHPVVPRAALTVPRVFLHIAPSIIPGAGLGIFATRTLPRGVRFGPYRGRFTDRVDTPYCWQLYSSHNKPRRVVDAGDARRSNWMRYVNCARHALEQNLVAFQYKGQLYYRTIRIIPRFTELLVFYGGEYALRLGVDLAGYNKPLPVDDILGEPDPKRRKKNEQKEVPKGKERKEKEEVTKGSSSITNSVGNIVNVTKNGINSKTVKKIKQLNNFKAPIKAKETKTSKVIHKKSTKIDENDQNNNKPVKNALKEVITKTKNVINFDDNYKYCNECNAKYLTKHALERHITKCHNKNIVCDICNERFVNKHTLCNHKLTEHNVYTKDFQVYNCKECDYKTCFKNYLVAHTKTHKNKSFNYSSVLVKHKIIHTGEKPYSCDICNKSFNVSCNLVIHKRIHTGEKPYSCDICNKSFNYSSVLVKHKRIHTGEKPYSCDMCNKSFNQQSDLVKHKRIHTGEKPYSCDICNKSFNLHGNLIKHKIIHTGEKPYSCDICNKSFNQYGSLVRHKRIHTGEKPYSCDICNKSFNRHGILVIHKRIHTGEKPYSCDICNKSFNQHGYLVIHKRIHTGEKPYSCDICKKSFNQHVHLVRHKRIHTGEKPYSCDICDYTSVFSSSLKKHLKTKHLS